MEFSRPWPWTRGASKTTPHHVLGLGGQVLDLRVKALGLDHFSLVFTLIGLR